MEITGPLKKRKKSSKFASRKVAYSLEIEKWRGTLEILIICTGERERGREEGLYILEGKIFLLLWLPGLHKIGRNLKAYWQVFRAIEDRSITKKWEGRRWGGGHLISQHNFHLFSCLIIKIYPIFHEPILFHPFINYLRLLSSNFGRRSL